jgi:hypothetical protein
MKVFYRTQYQFGKGSNTRTKLVCKFLSNPQYQDDQTWLCYKVDTSIRISLSFDLVIIQIGYQSENICTREENLKTTRKSLSITSQLLHSVYYS